MKSILFREVRRCQQTRLILGRHWPLALPAHETPFVGTLRLCDEMRYGQEVRSSVGDFVWVDFATLQAGTLGGV